MLLEIKDDHGTVLAVPTGSYMVVADGWRGRLLHAVAKLLYR